MALSEYIVMRELNHPDINQFAVYRRLGGWMPMPRPCASVRPLLLCNWCVRLVCADVVVLASPLA